MISVGVVGSLGLLVMNASFGLCVQHLQVISSQGKRVSLVLTVFLFFSFFFSFFFSVFWWFSKKTYHHAYTEFLQSWPHLLHSLLTTLILIHHKNLT